MSADLTARLAALLAEHDAWDYGGPGVIQCVCGWRSERLGPEWNGRREERHRAHVAAVLAEAGVGFVAEVPVWTCPDCEGEFPVSQVMRNV